MESGILRILLMRRTRSALAFARAALLAAACWTTVAAAQNDDGGIVGGDPIFTPEPERRAISEAKIDARDIELGLYAGFISIEDFGSDALFGASLGYHVTEDFFVEALVGMSEAGKTSFELLAGFESLSLGYQLLPANLHRR